MIIAARTLRRWLRRPPLAALLALGLLLPAVLPATARAQSAPQLSDETSAGLGQLRALTDAKNYPAALALIDRLAAAAPAGSYDLAVLLQVKTQVLLALGRYDDAIAPLRQTLDLGARHAFFAKPDTRDQLYLLAQLYGEKAARTAADPALQASLFDQAQAALRRRRELSSRPEVDASLLSATLLYEQATARPGRVDLDLVRQARDLAAQTLLLAVRPKDDAYRLLLACHQQLGEQAAAADTLELLVLRHPDSASTWRQLAGSCLALASSAQTRSAARDADLHAILAIERAQARGLLRSPAENATLVALYFKLGRLGHGIDLLQAGLKDKGIDDTPANWEMLASAYRQTHDDARAAAALETAVAHFPKDGPLEFSLARLLYDQKQPAATYLHLQNAVAKGGLRHPGEALRFLAYLAYERKDYAAALRWAGEAPAKTDASRAELDRLIRAARAALPSPASRP